MKLLNLDLSPERLASMSSKDLNRAKDMAIELTNFLDCLATAAEYREEGDEKEACRCKRAAERKFIPVREVS